MKYKVTNDQNEFDIEVRENGDQLDVSVTQGASTESFTVDFKTGGQGAVHSMLINGASYRVVINKLAQGQAVYTRGHRFEFNVEDERTFLMRKLIGGSSQKTAGEVKAPIPGLVTKILHTEGDKIESGQGILILEAMKMENEIKAPIAGMIKKIYVQSGKNVEKGQALFLIEPS